MVLWPHDALPLHVPPIGLRRLSTCIGKHIYQGRRSTHKDCEDYMQATLSAPPLHCSTQPTMPRCHMAPGLTSIVRLNTPLTVN